MREETEEEIETERKRVERGRSTARDRQRGKARNLGKI